MARPLNVNKRIRELVDGLLQDVFGRDIQQKGKPPIAPARLSRLYQINRLKAERPTRDIDAFIYVQEVLASMPAAYAAIRQLSEDVALDESGDPRAWNLTIGVDPLDDSSATTDKIAAFKDLCKAIFSDWALRTGIGDEAKNYVFKFLTAGDCFAEQTISIDTTTGLGRVEEIRELPTWQMFVLLDELGKLIGYEQRLFGAASPSDLSYGSGIYGIGSTADVTWDIPAQIIHWKYQPTAYIPYGQSIFAHLRNRWEQFKLIELDTIAAIHTHAIDPEVHLLGAEDGSRLTDDEINKYKSELRDNPTDINRFYVGRKGEVEYMFPKLGSADAVSKLIEAHRDLENRFVAAMVPGQSGTNAFDATRRAVATSFDQKYARKVTSVRQDFTRYLKASLFLEIALHGIDWAGSPEKYGAKKITLEISWPDISETRLQRSTRVLKEWVAGMRSHESSLIELGFNDPEGEMDLIDQEHTAGDWPIYLPLQGAAPEPSPNGEQGKGVPKGDSGTQAQVMLPLFDDPEAFREIIREEIRSALDSTN